MKKILDVFIFNNEIELLKLRLEFMGPYIDYFIISECDRTFSGDKKEFTLNPSVIKNLPYAEKIIFDPVRIHYHSIEWLIKRIRYKNRPGRFSWKILDYQRNSAAEILRKFDKDDIVYFGDLDEIPSLEVLQNIHTYQLNSQNPALACQQYFYYYHIHNFAPKEIWAGTIVTTSEYLIKNQPHTVRSQRYELPRIPQGGYHLSYFMNAAMVGEKVRNFAAMEKLEQYASMTDDEIQRKISEGIDLFNRNIVFAKDTQNYASIDQPLINLLERHLPNCA